MEDIRNASCPALCQQFPDRDVRKRPLAPGRRARSVCVAKFLYNTHGLLENSIFLPGARTETLCQAAIGKNEIFLRKTAAVGILHKQNNDMHCKNALLPVCKCSVCIKSGIILFVKKWGNSNGMEITVDSNSQNVL